MFLRMKTKLHPQSALKSEHLQELFIALGLPAALMFSVGISLREREALMKILHAPMLREVRNNMIVPPQQPLCS